MGGAGGRIPEKGWRKGREKMMSFYFHLKRCTKLERTIFELKIPVLIDH